MGVDAVLPMDVTGLDGREAAVAGSALVPVVLERCGARPGVFARVQALRDATDALTAALNIEDGAERRDQDAEQQAVLMADGMDAAHRAASAGLDRCAGPDGDRDALRRALAQAMADWQDPFAADAVGEAALGAMDGVIDGAPAWAAPSLVGLHDAIVRMRASGLKRDQAAAQRAVAVQARVEAEGRWQSAARGLVAHVGPGPWWEVARPAVALAGVRRSVGAQAEDDWFS